MMVTLVEQWQASAAETPLQVAMLMEQAVGKLHPDDDDLLCFGMEAEPFRTLEGEKRYNVRLRYVPATVPGPGLALTRLQVLACYGRRKG